MKNIAIVIAHSDDEILSMGGTLFKLRDKNPIIIYTSKSAYNTFTGQIERTEEETEIETDQALISLGFNPTNKICLNYPTKYVPYNSEIIEKLDKLFHDYNITTVFTHAIDDTHSDHANTARAVLTAARRINSIFTFEPIFPANSISLYQPKTYIDISGQPYERKILALLQHVSQVKKYGQVWLDSVDALSRIRGIEINKERAECFCCIKQELDIL